MEKRVIRFRLGNEMRGGRYWEDVENKVCRVCGGEEETWEHVWEKCERNGERGVKGWQEVMREILGEDGEGEEWIRGVEVRRGKGVTQNER